MMDSGRKSRKIYLRNRHYVDRGITEEGDVEFSPIDIFFDKQGTEPFIKRS